ncbi:MAG TPA: tyrosine--tRNA ligase, partial [Beutenbergiaceae bacterium]|nr:tyrosine--tRNA ligase [Beutenbergiaceae bacterium]
MTDIVAELRWRGLIAQSTDDEALREALAQGPVTYYCGFDPTAPSLHHGHLVQLLMLRHLQLAGHKAIALVGGGTGLIGDPRMSGERSLNPAETVAEWAQGLQEQISRFLDFDGDNPALLVNNYDWISELSTIDFLREIGKHFRLGTMLAKDTVARRLDSEEGISYTEFSYQVLQALDFLELHQRYGCILQTGGNDQWGNLVAGVELIRRHTGKHVHALTTPLITKSDGTKFGKTEGGAVWLDPRMMSPYEFYQFWINTEDADVERFLKVFTLLTREEITDLVHRSEQKPAARIGQRALARSVTSLVHGVQACDDVESASQALFGRGELTKLDQATLADAVEQLPSTEMSVGHDTIVDLLIRTGLCRGRNDARRTVADGGAY